jgi:GTP-binding protein
MGIHGLPFFQSFNFTKKDSHVQKGCRLHSCRVWSMLPPINSRISSRSDPALIIKSADFIKSATRPENFPSPDLPEVAFAGRSNVGKSSMINVLVNRKGLVRTSSTPGRTQLLNFFAINGTFSLVDLPGYGYARVPLAVRKTWGPMVRTYLQHRPNLKALILLFDIRRVPKEEDLQLLDWLEEFEIPTIPVITKADKVGKSQRAGQIRPILEATGLLKEAFTLFSSATREGREEVWERIETALGI